MAALFVHCAEDGQGASAPGLAPISLVTVSLRPGPLPVRGRAGIDSARSCGKLGAPVGLEKPGRPGVPTTVVPLCTRQDSGVTIREEMAMARHPRASALALTLCVTALEGWGGGSASAQVPPTRQALNALYTAYPDVQVHESGGRIKAVYGVPMTTGTTARQAAENWLALYAPVFGEVQPVLPDYSEVKLKNNRTVYSFSQTIAGVPVMNGLVTVFVHHSSVPTAVYAAGRVAVRPAGGFPAQSVLAGQALLIAQAHAAAAGLTQWDEPQLWAWWDDHLTGGQAVRIWRCEGRGGSAQVFLVDAWNGNVVHHYDPRAGFDITGTVRAYVSPGLYPHTAAHMGSCQNSPTALVDLANILVRATTVGGTTYETYTSRACLTDGASSGSGG